jgi:outer membrane receptor for ferrienterochelin and colicin
LNRRFTICFFLLAWAALIAAPALGQEEEDTGEFDELEEEFELLQEDEIVYTAAKHEQDIADSPSAITVISREQIQNTHCTDLVCLLRQVPELEIRRVLPLYHAVGARALGGELTDKGLVFVDGREINVDVFGVPYYAGLPVHLEDIERIEVIRGPGSALYGANAHSLVVSITTRKSDEQRAEVFLGAGEHDRTNLHLRGDLPVGEWQLNLLGGLETAGHWRLPDTRERESYRVRLRAVYEDDSSSTDLHAGLVHSVGQFYTSVGPGNLNPLYLAHFLASHSREWLKAKVSFLLFDGVVEPDLPLYYGDIKLGALPDSIELFSTTLDSEIQTSWSPFEGNLLLGGVNYRWISFYSDANDPSEEHQHRVGVFLQDEQRLFDQLLINVGLRMDYNNITPLSFSPRAAVVWRFTANQLVRFAFGRAFRKPSFFNTSLHFTGVKGEKAFPELGNFFRYNVGNDDLGNESVTAFEAGYRGKFSDQLTVEAITFFNMYRDTINFYIDMKTNSLGVPDLTTSIMQFSNEGREVNTIGGSLSLTFQIRESLRIFGNYTYRYSWYISDPLGTVQEKEGGKGHRVVWEPAHLANLGLYYLFEAGLRLGGSAFFRSSYEQAVTEGGSLFGDTIVLTDPFTVTLNAFASWRFDFGSHWFEAGVRGFNVLNAGFRDTVAVRRPDGVDLGGELMGRRLFFFVRGGI